ncbi:MAG: hypothetical protein AUJ23_02300 [Candidatus Magasanikbacteria bacterium CG1_02_32_51]|uniref:PPM-type phosphatase domain-containing protein n=1 Tax=Candidatus Magasanikbacteria bacterium CG1_02_32_51 TaxID=1805238 RepID=A0A1J4U483_9BACT|nr:MAG: hypothetical protein AUJ23_02300 [Candidatus Magasanikbacteria bacterium CG1_02_32_51]
MKVVKDVQTCFFEINKEKSSNFLTTFSMVKIHKGYCLVASVGDSPVFLQTDHDIEQITIAHDKIREGFRDNGGKKLPSSIDELVDTNFNFDKEGLQARQRNPGIIRNNPTSFVGRKEGSAVDFYVRKLEKGNIILLASDGAIENIDKLSMNTKDSLQKVADGLVENFYQDDDATILLLKN